MQNGLNILNKHLNLAWFFLVAGSIALRIPGLFDQASWWRAIQTEMTSYWFQKEGIDLLNYQTPLYGPPWQIPFEFPLYQASATILAKIWPAIGPGTTPTNISISGRLAAMLFFLFMCVFPIPACKEIY